MDVEKQKRVIRFLVEKWATLQREQLVFDEFVRELKEEGRLGILEHLHKIRHSARIQEAHAATFRSLDSIVSSALGEMSLDQVEKLTRHITPSSGEPN